MPDPIVVTVNAPAPIQVAVTEAVVVLPGGGGGAVSSVDGRTGAVTLSDLYAAIVHSHAVSSVTGLQAALDAKQDITAALTAFLGATTVGSIHRTGLNTYASRTLTGSTNINVTNGDGASGNPTVSITGTVGVANGGTGRATGTTAFGLVAVGTTATGAQQTIAPGTAGHFLKSAGGSALASFAALAAADVSDFNTAADARVNAVRGLYVGINAQTGTTYAPVLTDQGKLVTLSNAAAITVTLPSDATTAFPVGTQIDFAGLSASPGLVTFVAGASATVNGTPSLVTRAQYSTVTAIKYAANTWLVVGDLA